MRFLRLDLRAFGSFDGPPPLDLSGGQRGLHLVLGPNEAGKSTALRAIRHLLFGFPLRSPDDHLHKYDKFRLAAIILGEKGEELAFTRRKKEINPLWTFVDDEPIPTDALAPFLGTLDETKFNDLFAMDHAELVAGGKLIIEGKGNLGSILFAAGSGLARVDEVRKSLDAEVDALFKPTGKNPAINAALAELKVARDESERAMLATSSWVELDATLARELACKASVDAEINETRNLKLRLERLRDSLPVIDRIDRGLAQLVALGDAPMLSDGFADRRHEATVARQVGRKAGLDAEATLEVIAHDLETLGPRNPILDEADAIRRVRDDLGLYRKALKTRPIDQSKLARLEADARGVLLELRPGDLLDEAGSFRIPAAVKGRIQALAQELAKLDERRSTAELDVAKLLNHGQASTLGVEPAEVLRLAEALDQAMKRGQAEGDLEAQLASNRLDLARLEQQAAVDLRKLPLWSGPLDELEALAVPSNETLDRFVGEFSADLERLKSLGADLARLELEQAGIDRELARGQSTGPVPTEEELATRRGLRDDRWRRIRRGWLDGEPVESPLRMADDFESAIRAVDDMADRLRREADAVADQARRQWRRRELLDEIATLTVNLDRAKQDREAIQADWLGVWLPLRIDPLTPREMKDWIAIGRADLLRQAKGVRDRRIELAEKAAKIETIKADLGRHLAELGEPTPDPRESLAALLARARSAVDRVDASLRLEAARATLTKVEDGRAGWNERWGGAVGPLGLPVDASPLEALEAIEKFNGLASLMKDVLDLRGGIDDHARVEARFEAEVRPLAARLEIGSSDALPEAIARDVDDRFKRALVNETRREEALKRQLDERAKLEKARLEVDRADASLAALVVEARCGSPDELVEAERRSDEIKGLKKELRSFEDQLTALAGPIPVAKVREEATEVDPESLVTRIADLTDQLAPLEAERDRLGEAIGRCREKLDAMDGGPAAAEAQQGVEDRLTRLAMDVERYARLRLASAVLREAVERHRKEHQGPILDRAGALFAAFTIGSFAGLRAELDDKGQPVLLGIRGDGEAAWKVDAMSEGTADQLYLALRLASLQAHLDAHEPIPLILDDILVNFDNARALAALRVLADLSVHTQILFFTHHAHLIDLAHSALPEDVLFVHHLAYPPVRINGLAEGPDGEVARPKRKKKAPVVEGD